MKILSMPKGQDVDKLMIYKDGTQYLSLESPGSYVASDPIVGASFLSDRISIVNSGSNVCIVGLVTPVDLTDYVAVHIISKHNSGSHGVTIYVNNTKNTAGYINRQQAVVDAAYHETVLDVSSITGNNYVFITTDSYNTDNDVKEIWLSKT